MKDENNYFAIVSMLDPEAIIYYFPVDWEEYNEDLEISDQAEIMESKWGVTHDVSGGIIEKKDGSEIFCEWIFEIYEADKVQTIKITEDWLDWFQKNGAHVGAIQSTPIG